jgi:hypothetical protein
MKDNVDYLPIWKKNATPEEKFMELALIARKHPEKFNRMIVVYQQQHDGYTQTRYADNELSLIETLGLIEMAKFEIIKECYSLVQE